MKVYAICYDLNNPGQDYQPLYDAIKEISDDAWWCYLDSTWLICTNKSAEQISDVLRANIDDNDSLLVIRVSEESAGWLPKDAWDWLRKYLG